MNARLSRLLRGDSDGNARLRDDLSRWYPDAPALHAWLKERARDSTSPARSTILRRYRMVSAQVNGHPGEQKPARNERIRAFFAACDPRATLGELQEASRLSGFSGDYLSYLDKLEQDPTIRDVVHRYRLPKVQVQNIAVTCMAPLATVRPDLERLIGALQDHTALMKSLQAGRVLQAGVQIAASVVGSMLLGRIGSRAAGLLVGEAMNPGEKISASMTRISQAFEAYTTTCLRAIDDSTQSVENLVTSLYGGLHLRVAQDLWSMGYQVESFSPRTARITVRLAPDSQARFDTWIQNVCACARALLSNGRFEEVLSACDSTLGVLGGDPVKARAMASPEETWSVVVASYRTFALVALGDRCWNAGDWPDAASLYLRALTDFPIAVEPHGTGVSSIGRAGWRLALWESSRGHGMDVNRLLALPRYCALFQKRTETLVASRKALLPGEQVPEETRQLAHVLARYADDASLCPMATWSDSSNPAVWPPYDVEDVLAQFGPDDAQARSPMVQWLERLAAKERRRRLKRAVLIGLGVAASLLLVTGGVSLIRRTPIAGTTPQAPDSAQKEEAGSPPTSTSSPPPAGRPLYVAAARSSNLRAIPDPDGTLLARVPRGAQVIVTGPAVGHGNYDGIGGAWAPVWYQGSIGFLFDGFLLPFPPPPVGCASLADWAAVIGYAGPPTVTIRQTCEEIGIDEEGLCNTTTRTVLHGGGWLESIEGFEWGSATVYLPGVTRDTLWAAARSCFTAGPDLRGRALPTVAGEVDLGMPDGPGQAEVESDLAGWVWRDGCTFYLRVWTDPQGNGVTSGYGC